MGPYFFIVTAFGLIASWSKLFEWLVTGSALPINSLRSHLTQHTNVGRWTAKGQGELDVGEVFSTFRTKILDNTPPHQEIILHKNFCVEKHWPKYQWPRGYLEGDVVIPVSFELFSRLSGNGKQHSSPQKLLWLLPWLRESFLTSSKDPADYNYEPSKRIPATHTVGTTSKLVSIWVMIYVVTKLGLMINGFCRAKTFHCAL